MAYAGAIMGFAGGLMSGIGGRKSQGQQNRIYQQAANLFTPGSINTSSGQLNPWLWGALGGQRGTSGYQQGLYNIAQQPGYIDPRLMNQAYTQSAQGQQSDLARAQSMLGANMGGPGGGGGLANAYALANLSARTGRDVNLGQQYSLWREQQRRADLDWLAGQISGTQGMAGNLAQSQASYLARQQPKQNWLQIGGNALQSAAAGMGGMAGLAGGGQGNPYGLGQVSGAGTSWQQPWVSTGQFGQGGYVNMQGSWQPSGRPGLEFQRTTPGAGWYSPLRQ